MFLTALVGISAHAADVPATNHWRIFTQMDGLPENACLSVTPGSSGNVLLRHPQLATVTEFDGYGFTSIPDPKNYRSRVYESPGGQLWTVAREGVQEFRDGAWIIHPVPQVAEYFRRGNTNEIRLQPIRQGRVLIFLPQEELQLTTDDAAQIQIESLTHTSETSSPNPVSTPSDCPNVGQVSDVQTGADGTVWVATSNGLLRRSRELWESTTPPSATDIVSNPQPSDLKSDAPPGEWTVAFKSSNGDEWFGGEHGMARLRQGVFRFFLSSNQLGPEEVFAFTEAPDGRFWCGTTHKVWEFDGRNWLISRGGFERVNALHCTRDGTLWIATSEGVHRQVQAVWIANGVEDGLPSPDVLGVHELVSGGIAVETSHGWSAFHPENDITAPLTSISSDETRYPEDAVIRLTFGGRDKWDQTTSGRLLFSYRLDARDWSPFQDTHEVTFTDLKVGRHYFQVRAMDRAGNIDQKRARLDINVLVPWYRETRLVFILAGALVVALFFAGLAFNRHRKLQSSYKEIERQVAERTHQLELANRELLHSQKMNALGALSAGIAHDFNNILSIIKGSAQIIEDNTDNPEKIRVRVDRIKTVVQQGAEVVDAMLGFSRSTDEPPAPCDLNLVVDETRKLLGDRFLREVEVSFERGEGIREISIRRDFVQQILLNFIFNAAESMSGRKQIKLATRLAEKLPDELFLSPAAAGQYVFISVSDIGSGIAPEIKSRIFEPFFTTKALSTKRGTGLGLSMVYELAKKLEAGLALESTVGKGSRFTLILGVRK